MTSASVGRAEPPRQGPASATESSSGSFRKRALLILAAALLLAGGLFVGKALWHSFSALDAVRGLRPFAAAMAEGRVRPEELVQARVDLAKLSGELATLEGHLRPTFPLQSRMGWLPSWGHEVAASPQLLAMGVTAARTAEHALAGATPLLTRLQEGAGMSDLLLALSVGAEDLQAARREVMRLRELRQSLGPSSRFQPTLRSVLDRFDQQASALGGVLGLAGMLPQLLGNERPSRYLLLGQNNDELRATGGFTSTAGLLTVSRGAVQELDYRDSYGFDSPAPPALFEPPAPYQRYMLLETWRLRDANWWADFPTSARQAEVFLRLEQGVQVDGVVAFDQSLLEKVLSVLGPLDVPSFQERVDASNVVAVMEAYAHPTGYKEGYVGEDVKRVNDPDRKAFIRELASVLLERAQQLDPIRAVQMGRVLKEALDQKHLLLYSNDPQAAEALQELGLDGAVHHPSAGDFLMVVETNVGFSKANRYVDRSLDYQLTLGPGFTPVQAAVTVTYRNRNDALARHCAADVVDYYTADDSCYKSYVRVYTPPGTVPLGASGLEGALEWFQEGENTVLAGLVVLPPGASKQVRFTYVPPRSVVLRGPERSYQLYLQKQPGTDALPTTITLFCPGGGRGAAPAPPATPECPQKVSRTLATDQQIKLPLP